MMLMIEDDEAFRLATELAEAIGTSVEDAVILALRRTVADETDATPAALLIDGVAEIQALVAEIPDRDARAPDQILGYDGSGAFPPDAG